MTFYETLKFNSTSFSIEYGNYGDISYDNTFSFNPAYYNSYVYFHAGEKLYKVDKTGNNINSGSFFSSSLIDYSTNNLNSTVVISKRNNYLFICGYWICAIDLNSGQSVWCSNMTGGSNQGVTPAVDDYNNNVYVYDDGSIKVYNQIDGKIIGVFGEGVLDNQCNSRYTCLSSQPIVTKHNLFWADGTNVYVFDKNTQKQVLKIDSVCATRSAHNYNDYDDDIANSIALYGEYLIVSCAQKVVMYQFKN